jgi:PASTA domain
LTVALALSACATSTERKFVVVPHIRGLSQSAATSILRHVGLRRGDISGISSQSPAGTVIASNPSAGMSVTHGAVVSLTVSGGQFASPPTQVTQPVQTTCASGHVAYTESESGGSVCLKVGSTLTVTFVPDGGWSGYGNWSRSPPAISDNSVLRGGSYRSSGKAARAVFQAVGAGAANVMATFDVTCAPGNTTPCTVPPAAFQSLAVTVDP